MQCLLVAALASMTMAVSTSSDLEWSNHYANAKSQAAQDQRPLLVVVENATDPGGRFDADRLASNTNQRELLKKYQLCRMDVNTPYGKKVADAFGAGQFPMTVITDKSAQFITYRVDGAVATDQWEQTLAVRSTGEGAQPVRVEASKIIIPAYAPQQPVSNCPNCVRSQQQYYYQ